MNSRDYWQKRSEDRFLKAEADIVEAQKTLAQSFERARREIQSQIDAFYGRYARNNAVSLSEAQKALSLADLRDFKDDLAAFRKLAFDSMSTFNLELENLSAQARVTRLQALKCRMDAVVERLYISQRELIGGTAVEVYSDQYHRTLFDVDQYTGFHAEFARINDAAVKRLLDYPFDGLMFSTRLWRQSEDLKPQIQQLVNRMFVTGKPPQDFADELAARFGVKAKEAYRLLYTEGAFVAEQATLDAYREDEIGRYQYTAALDAKTCETCGELDGKEFAVKDAKPGINYPPMHPWCRCTTVPVVEGVGQEGERFARDGDGNAIEVPSGMTYRQWKGKFIDAGARDGIIEVEEKLGKISQDEGRLLRGKKETAIVYGPDGSTLFVKKGGERSVRFTSREVAQMKGGILTHNHPEDTTFSPADINMLRGAGLAEIRAVTSGGVYRLRQPAHWDTAFNTREKIEAEYARLEKIVEPKIWARCEAGEISVAEYNRIYQHQILQQLAEQFGLEYIFEVK